MARGVKEADAWPGRVDEIGMSTAQDGCHAPERTSAVLRWRAAESPPERPSEHLVAVEAFGSGDPLSEAQFMAIHQELERRKVTFAWAPGDVMLLENQLTCHGRHPYTGEREVEVMLFE